MKHNSLFRKLRAFTCLFIPSVPFFYLFIVFAVLVRMMMVTFRVFAMHLALSMRFHDIIYDNGSISVRENLFIECDHESNLNAIGIAELRCPICKP